MLWFLCWFPDLLSFFLLLLLGGRIYRCRGVPTSTPSTPSPSCSSLSCSTVNEMNREIPLCSFQNNISKSMTCPMLLTLPSAPSHSKSSHFLFLPVYCSLSQLTISDLKSTIAHPKFTVVYLKFKPANMHTHFYPRRSMPQGHRVCWDRTHRKKHPPAPSVRKDRGTQCKIIVAATIILENVPSPIVPSYSSPKALEGCWCQNGHSMTPHLLVE